MTTLVLTGNNFGDISNDVIGEVDVHRSLSLVNLTSDKITKISSKVFENTPNVEYLHLHDNSIVSAGKNTFGNMQRLRRLDMTSSLGKRSAASKADLLSLMFETEDAKSFPELSEILLGGNQIGQLHKDTFCKISGLVRLVLSDNQLTSFEVGTNCLQTLKALDLSGNKFVTFSSTLWDSLPQLTTLDISSNPIRCDCQLQPFLRIVRSEHSDFSNQGKTLCAEPSALKEQNLFEYKGDLCKAGGWGFGTLLLLGITAGAVLFAYRHYRSRRPAPMPFQFGYSGLDTEEDVQPEFV